MGARVAIVADASVSTNVSERLHLGFRRERPAPLAAAVGSGQGQKCQWHTLRNALEPCGGDLQVPSLA